MQFHFLLHIWVWDDCRSISQQIYKRTISNLIRKNWMWWICWGPVASKNLANICLMKKLVKNIWEIFAPWTDKNGIVNFFFSARPTCTTHQISYLSDSTLTFFANNFANIWQDIWKQISILKFGQFCIILRKNNRFQIIKEQEKIFTFKKFKKMSISMGKVMVLCLLISTRFLTFIFLWQTKAFGAIAFLSVAFHLTKFQLFTFSTKQW